LSRAIPTCWVLASERLPRPRNEVSALAVGPAGLGRAGMHFSAIPRVQVPDGEITQWVVGGYGRRFDRPVRGRETENEGEPMSYAVSVVIAAIAVFAASSLW
jgi:hypothetical protein